MPIEGLQGEPQSRAEIIGRRQIELAEETNTLLREILQRLPAFAIVPLEYTQPVHVEITKHE